MKISSRNNLTAIDPVCGFELDPAKSTFMKSVGGHIYHFCTEKCRNDFTNNPMKYTDVLNFTKKNKNWWGRYLDRV